MSTKNSTSHTINLDILHSAEALPFGGSLHQEEVGRVLELVQQHLRDLESSEKKEQQRAKPSHRNDKPEPLRASLAHRHDTILIHGGRGSGKSTLLVTLRDLFNAPTESPPRDWLERRSGGSGRASLDLLSGVYMLPSLDPTLVEGDEVFLATITSNILREIDRNSSSARTSAHVRRGERGATTADLDKALDDLADGFRVLYAEAAKEDFKQASSNPQLFAERLLRNASGGLELAARFHKFCTAACEALGVQVLIQPIDDADVAINEGWNVLETVRRYLSSGKVLPMLLGDLDLFHLVVMNEQWKHLKGLAKSLNKAKNDQSRRSLVNQIQNLSDQYLLKLVRAERRIALPRADLRLREWVANGEIEIVRGDRPEDGSDYKASLTALLRAAGTKLLGAPIDGAEQTGWQLIPPNTREMRGVMMWLTDTLKASGELRHPNDPDPMLGYQEVFAGPLAEVPGLRDALDGLRTGDLNGWQSWLSQRRDHVPYWKLSAPTDALEDEARAAKAAQPIITGRLVARWRQHPAEQLSYWGSILSPMTAHNDGLIVEGMPEAEASEDEIARRWRVLGRLGAGEPAWLSAARMTVLSIPASAVYSNVNQSFFGGASRLPPRTNYRAWAKRVPIWHAAWRRLPDPLAFDEASSKLGAGRWLHAVAGQQDRLKQLSNIHITLFPTINQWLNATDYRAKIFLNLFRVVARIDTGNYDIIDPWKGIAALGDIARELPADKDPSEDEVRDALSKLCALSTRTTIRILKSSGDAGPTDIIEDITDDNDINNEENIEKISEQDTAFLKDVADWFGEFRSSKCLLSAGAWADIAERFAQNLNNIHEARSSEEHSTGLDLELWVLAFLHCVLYVEATLRGKAAFNNDPKSEKRLDERLSVNSSSKNKGSLPMAINLGRLNVEALPMFALLARCPLLTGLLSEPWRGSLFVALKDTNSSENVKKWIEVTTLGFKTDIHTSLCSLVPVLRSPKPEQMSARQPSDPPKLGPPPLEIKPKEGEKNKMTAEYWVVGYLMNQRPPEILVKFLKGLANSLQGGQVGDGPTEEHPSPNPPDVSAERAADQSAPVDAAEASTADTHTHTAPLPTGKKGSLTSSRTRKT